MNETKTTTPPKHAAPGALVDILLISGALIGLLVMFVSAIAVDHDKKWSEARQVLVETRAEIERRLIADRDEWEATRQRRIRQLETERPDGSDRDEIRRWREEREEEERRPYQRSIGRVLGLENGDMVLFRLEWDGTMRYFRRADFRFFVGGNRPSETSGQSYFIEVIGEPGAYGDEDAGIGTPEGVLRIYSDGSIEGPLPLSEATSTD